MNICYKAEMEELAMGLGKNIATLRKFKGMTQEKLAEQCNVSRQAVAKWETGESEPSIEKLVALSRVFNIRIDTLVNAEKENPLKVKDGIDRFDYGMIARCIDMLNRAKYLDCQSGESTKNSLLIWLYKSIRDKYIDENGKVKDEYLLCNTKERDRESHLIFIKGLFTDENNPCTDYIQGKCEINVVLDAIDAELEKRTKNISDETDRKRETELVNLSFSYLRLMSIDDFEDYSEKYFCDILEKLHNEVAKLGKDTFVERFMIFFANEIEMAINNRDAQQIEELFYEWWWMWEDYIWYKA